MQQLEEDDLEAFVIMLIGLILCLLTCYFTGLLVALLAPSVRLFIVLPVTLLHAALTGLLIALSARRLTGSLYFVSSCYRFTWLRTVSTLSVLLPETASRGYTARVIGCLASADSCTMIQYDTI